MALKKINPEDQNAWKKLKAHFNEIKKKTIVDLFKEEDKRAYFLSVKWNDFYIDFSKNRINKTTLKLLMNLANNLYLKETIKSYFSGEAINETENRAVLHTALRKKEKESVFINNENIIPEITAIKNRIKYFSDTVIQGKHKGYTQKKITDIVNIGIGGSDLGPDMVTKALSFYKNHLQTHFVSNIDGDSTQEVLQKIKPETTLFVIISKTFTTQETITNATTIKEWFLKKAPKNAVKKHFIAVSSNTKEALKFGINKENIFPIKDWVGGRFSMWSAAGITIALALGFENFQKLLDGAREMDQHFEKTPFTKNIPVILALISIWYNNFWKAETEAIIPYADALKKLPDYLQQGCMESNGKNIDRNGNKIQYQTGTIIWGATGTNSQHAFFQLIHQGTKLIPTDFIGFTKSHYNNTNHHNKLMANFFGQTKALMQGKNKNEVEVELKRKKFSKEKIKQMTPFQTFDGNKPSNTILIEKLTPKNLGALIAMYEHKIFTQGILWNIFSFDQWGVELGKELANDILKNFETNDLSHHDPSTKNLIKIYLNK